MHIEQSGVKVKLSFRAGREAIANMPAMPLLIPVLSNARIEFVESLGIRKMVFKAALNGVDPMF